MEALTKPEAEMLKKISSLSNEDLKKIPNRYKTLVWELNQERFLQELRPLITTFLYDYKLRNQCLEWLFTDRTQIPRQRRKMNSALKQIKNLIGASSVLYMYTVQEIHLQYSKTKDSMLCCLRSDLIMLYQDNNVSSITSKDSSFKLAWYLDSLYKKLSANLSSGETMVEAVEKNPRNFINEIVSISKNEEEKDLSSDEEGKKVVKLTTFPVEVEKLINQMKKEDVHKLFHKPVVEAYPHLAEEYLSIVQKPMDLQTMMKKAKKNKYVDLDQVQSDFFQIHTNSLAFNGPKHQITEIAAKLMRVRAKIHYDKAVSRLKESTKLRSKIARRDYSKREDIALLSRQERIRDAIMIVDARFNKVALIHLLTVLIYEYLLFNKVFLRKNEMIRNLFQILHLFGSIKSTDGIPNSELFEDGVILNWKSYKAEFTRVLPTFVLLCKYSIETRCPWVFFKSTLNAEEILEKTNSAAATEKVKSLLEKLCSFKRSGGFLIEILGTHILSRLKVRDLSFIVAFFSILREKGLLVESGTSSSGVKSLHGRLIIKNGFLHSLATSVFYANINDKAIPGNNFLKLAVKKRIITVKEQIPQLINRQPKLLPSFYTDALEIFYLPNIFATLYARHLRLILDKKENDAVCGFVLQDLIEKIEMEGVQGKNHPEELDYKFALAHADFGRFMTLPGTVHALSAEQRFTYVKIAILSLVNVFFQPDKANKNLFYSEEYSLLIKRGRFQAAFLNTYEKLKSAASLESLQILDELSCLGENRLNLNLQSSFSKAEFEKARIYYNSMFNRDPALREHCFISPMAQEGKISSAVPLHGFLTPATTPGSPGFGSPFPLTPSVEAPIATPKPGGISVMEAEEDSESE
eukprot:snap_masked-scaffold_13-processed-gene-11.49-mRNA-1 protein AED:1.00 eAED:1.00 QI:0/0/0/0/1/1/2/0/862